MIIYKKRNQVVFLYSQKIIASSFLFSLEAPIMTYILGTNKISNKKYFKDENGCDLCDKITYLGKKSLFLKINITLGAILRSKGDF